MFFRHRQQRRRWAARVLLLWLFGVAASVANACLGPAQGLGSGQVSVVAAHLGASLHDAAVPVTYPEPRGEALGGPQDGGCHEGATLKSNCADFCDKARVSIPSLKSPLDDLQGHALHFAGVAAAQPLAVGPLERPRRLCREGAWAPPVRIAYLRLAL